MVLWAVWLEGEAMNPPDAVGKIFTLWREEYELEAYKDQFGRTHEGYIVAEEIRVTVVEQRNDVPAMWSEGQTYWGLRAVAEDGREYTLNWTFFPDDARTPTYYWDCIIDDEGHAWQPVDAVQAYNHKLSAHVRFDGTRAVPGGAEVCPKHDYAYYTDREPFKSGDRCFHCFCDKLKAEREEKERGK